MSTDLSVLNFFMPTVHEWKRVALSMDLSVGAFNETNGLSFNANQSGDGVGVAGLFWGFLGVERDVRLRRRARTPTRSTPSRRRAGPQARCASTRSSAHGRPGSLPGAEPVAIGPQIVFSQGAVKETAVAGAGINRSVDVVVRSRKAGGGVTPALLLRIDAGGPAALEFSTTAPFTGNRRTPNGQVTSPSPATSRTRGPPPPA